MSLFRIIFLLSFVITLSFASGKDLAKSLGLNPSSKAIKQWERVFDKDGKMEKYGINKLSDADKEVLKKYLMNHAADSDQPAAAGI